MTTTENKPSLSKYEEALAKYNTNIDDNLPPYRAGKPLL